MIHPGETGGQVVETGTQVVKPDETGSLAIQTENQTIETNPTMMMTQKIGSAMTKPLVSGLGEKDSRAGTKHRPELKNVRSGPLRL